MDRLRWAFALALATMVAACGGGDTFDWEQFEDFTVEKSYEEQPDGAVKMTYIGLVNAPRDALFTALSDVEHHDEFIEDVKEVKLVSSKGNKKVVDIRNRVLGRDNEARIEWTIDEPSYRMAFKTVQAKFTDNSAEYVIESSPDGKRSRITTVYFLRDKGGHPFPLHLLKTAIDESYMKSVRGVKRRALGKSAVVGPG
jgi:hypothetical protein